MKFKKYIWPVVGFATIGFSAWLLFHELRGLSLDDLWDSLKAIRVRDWLCSGLATLLAYAALTGNRAVNDPAATNVAQMVIAGTREKTPKGPVFMPAFGAAYSDAEIAAVANYVTARFGAGGSRLTAHDVAELRRMN